MPGGRGNIRPEDGKQFGDGIDPVTAGRKGGKAGVSIKKEIARLLDNKGVIVFPKKQVIAIRENGDVEIRMPTKEALAQKLISWAMSNKDKGADIAFRLLEQFDGKAVQKLEHKEIQPKRIGYGDEPDDEEE